MLTQEVLKKIIAGYSQVADALFEAGLAVASEGARQDQRRWESILHKEKNGGRNLLFGSPPTGKKE